jgi:hypothetical protein
VLLDDLQRQEIVFDVWLDLAKAADDDDAAHGRPSTTLVAELTNASGSRALASRQGLLVLRHGHSNGRVSAAVTRSRICSYAAGLGRPASLLRDGHYNGRVSAAVTTVSPMQSCLTSWASAARHRGHQLKEHVRTCLPLVPMVSSTAKAGQCAAL